MNNREIATIFADMADLLELKRENPFKIRAYHRVAFAIKHLSTELEQLVREDRLQEVPGVGEAIAKKITELVTTGRLEVYERLKAEFPEGISALLAIPGVGPKTARLLTTELGVKSTSELETAIADGSVARLPGMGNKTAANIRRQLQVLRQQDA